MESEDEHDEIVGIMFDTSSDESSQDDIHTTFDFVSSHPDQLFNSYERRSNIYNDMSLEFDIHDSYENYLIHTSNQIYGAEQEFLDSEKESSRYYIGSATIIRNRYFIMNTAVTASTFLNFPINIILFYLYESSLFHFVKNKIEIMKLQIHPVTREYMVVLKTFWLRIVQRTWRRILKKRAEILKKRCSIQNIQHRLLYGRHQYGLNVLPGLIGMITC